MVRYQNILEDYFKELRSFYQYDNSAQMATAELSFRPFLDKFFVNLTAYIDSTIQRIFEPRNQSAYGRPDWVFTDPNTMGIYGYVEAKGLNPTSPINISEYESQVTRYLNLGNPVLLTDGVEFVYFDVNGVRESFSLVEKPINWHNPKYNIQSLSFFQKFFSKIGFRSIPEQMIITELSKRAKSLCSELVELLRLEEDETENETELATVRTLKKLWDTAATNLDVSLSDHKTFAGFIAQILAFGLLYAHRFVNNGDFTPQQNYDRLHFFWSQAPFANYSKNVEPFVHLFKALTEELNSKLSKIGCWYDNTRRLLAYVKLNSKDVEKPNFHQLYEDFLAEYDSATRVDFGAWYTPIYLSDYLAKMVYFHLQVNSGLKYLHDRPYHVIDPCCGTGTILESVLDNIPLPANSIVSGFEILPVPYALANYRLSFYDIPEDLSLSIHLTNTLGDNTFQKPEFDFNKLDSVGLFFAKEQVASYTISQPPLTIIIGNPPCSDSAITNAGSNLERLMQDFRPPIRKGRQNTQMQLTNEWIKFFRWGMYKAMESNPSLVAFVLPSTFAANITFKYARKYLIEHASNISIIEFDSDNRVESANQNIFNTLQGRLILLATFDKNAESTYIRYKDIRHLTRAQKEQYLSQPLNIIDWNILPINEEYSLRPIGKYDTTLYSRFVPLTATSTEQQGIFLRHCSGMKLAPTHLIVHFSKGQLSRRSKFIADLSHSYDDIKERWYDGQAKPPSAKKLTNDVRNAISNISPVRYSYRPFLEAYMNDSEDLFTALKETSGGGMRWRPEVKAAYTESSVYGFAVAPAPAEISREITKFCSFCWHIPDNDLSTRGNAHIYCNKFPNYKKGAQWDPTPQDNINPSLLDTLSQKYNMFHGEVQNYMVFYTYAILSSPYFLQQFAPKLHALAGQSPSIPVVEDVSLFKSAAQIGKRLASLERSDYVFTEEENKLLFNYQVTADLMPFELASYSIDEDSVTFLARNGESYTFAIKPEILSFSVSGYGIVREWLKYHSFAYYRKVLSNEEMTDFFNLIKRITLYLAEYDTLDELVRKILSLKLISL